MIEATEPVGATLAPHFYSFGGVAETARWINRVAAGAFEMDVEAGKFRVEG